MNRNLCKTVLSKGGSIIPLIIDPKDSKGLGLMNPSILVEQTKILLNLRNINYTLYHCEGSQLLNGRWGPLSYLHPEHDMHLRTYNFMCELDPTSLEITKYSLTDTSTLDKDPLWDFVGLEDARLVRWDGKLFQCGVRRDTTPNGQGRMELSEIKEEDGKFIEINRSRIQPPKDPNSYCEKNWMPVLDMPYHFVKWTNPTELVKVNTLTGTSQQVFVGNSHIPNMPDFRGGSQIIPWKNYRICMVHEVNLFNNKLSQKDATYTHRFIVWDKEWNIVKISENFSMMDGEIEFGCGMAIYKKDMLLTFGFQDNAAFILRIPENMIEELLGLKKKEFDWGIINRNEWFKNVLTNEIFTTNSYEKFFPVEENDTVLDVGASVGPFTYNIMSKKPKRVFCFEPSKELFPTLFKNTKQYNNVFCINKGVANKNGITEFKGLYDETTQNTFEASKPYGIGITFKDFLKRYNIDKIDFLKSDCEGGEYDIFNDENLSWIKQNVKKISGEWHLGNEELRKKWLHFRDTYLKEFSNFEIFSMDNVDIKWDVWNDHFAGYYGQIMLYIDNRPAKPPIEEKKIKIAVKNFGVPITKKENKELSYNDVVKQKLDKDDFVWGDMLKDNISILKGIESEIFTKNIYQKFFSVKKDDVVVDIGASVGPFAYSIFKQEPKHIYCLEPCTELFNTLKENTKSFKSATNINKGIGNKDSDNYHFDGLYGKNYINIPGNPETAQSIKFSSFIKEYKIDKIDFLKIDCEGGEYDIFNEANFEWITKNVKKMAVEFHFHSDEHIRKFKDFKNLYLKKFSNFKVYDLTEVDIKSKLWNDDFESYIKQFAAIMIYIDNDEKWKNCKWPTLEITTAVLEKGCIIDCTFCPQKVLLNSYKGERILSLENFKKALETVPKEITIIFSGFSEPWMNKEATNMLLHANEKGHAVAIFTTAIGMSKSDVDKIKSIKYAKGPDSPLTGTNGMPMLNGGFVLHLPDNEGYSKHPITKKYLEVLEYINSVKHEITGFRLVCLGTVHDKIKHIFPEAQTLALWSRADNLVKEEELKPELAAVGDKYNKIYQGESNMTCNCDENLYHGVLMPNGDVVLCCMDYGLEHVLGNLFTQTYNEFQPEDKTAFNLCRFCENGVSVNLKK